MTTTSQRSQSLSDERDYGKGNYLYQQFRNSSFDLVQELIGSSGDIDSKSLQLSNLTPNEIIHNFKIKKRKISMEVEPTISSPYRRLNLPEQVSLASSPLTDFGDNDFELSKAQNNKFQWKGLELKLPELNERNLHQYKSDYICGVECFLDCKNDTICVQNLNCKNHSFNQKQVVKRSFPLEKLILAELKYSRLFNDRREFVMLYLKRPAENLLSYDMRKASFQPLPSRDEDTTIVLGERVPLNNEFEYKRKRKALTESILFGTQFRDDTIERSSISTGLGLQPNYYVSTTSKQFPQKSGKSKNNTTNLEVPEIRAPVPSPREIEGHSSSSYLYDESDKENVYMPPRNVVSQLFLNSKPTSPKGFPISSKPDKLNTTDRKYSPLKNYSATSTGSSPSTSGSSDSTECKTSSNFNSNSLSSSTGSKSTIRRKTRSFLQDLSKHTDSRIKETIAYLHYKLRKYQLITIPKRAREYTSKYQKLKRVSNQ